MNIFKNFILITLLLLFLCGNTLILDNNTQINNITNSTSFLEDKNNSFSFEEIKNKNFTPSNKDFINFGVSNSAYWFRIDIINKSNQSNFILETTSPFFDEVTMYQKNDSNQYISKRIGNAVNFNQRDISNNLLIFRLNLKDNINTIYLKIYPGESKYTYFTINLGTDKSFFEKTNRISLINGIYFGVILLIVTYCFVLFFTLGDKIFIYYALSSICFSIVIGHLNGYTFEFLTTNNFWMNKHIDIFNYILSLFLTLFCMDFLQTKNRTPKLHIGLLIMITYYFVFIILNICGYMNLSRLGLEIAGSFGVYALILSFIILSQGYKIAKFYIIAQGSFFVFVNIFVMATLSIIPYNDFTANSLQIGSMLEIFFISFAISEKFISYKKEKEEGDQQLILQANQFSKKIIEIQEDEKKRVSAELHDSLGQNIIIIKNKVLSLIKNTIYTDLDLKLSEISKNIDNISDEVRNISYSLHPYHLKTIGLTESIKDIIDDFSEACDINFNFEIENIDNLFSPDNGVYIYRIIQECLVNCLKHSKAQNVILKITKESHNITIIVIDDGIGFNNKSIKDKNGFGLIGIKERLKVLNGNLEIDCKINETKLKIVIELSK